MAVKYEGFLVTFHASGRLFAQQIIESSALNTQAGKSKKRLAAPLLCIAFALLTAFNAATSAQELVTEPERAIDPISQFTPNSYISEPQAFWGLFPTLVTLIGAFIYLLPTVFLTVAILYGFRALQNFQRAKAIEDVLSALGDKNNG